MHSQKCQPAFFLFIHKRIDILKAFESMSERVVQISVKALMVDSY